jgi:single-stranded-DNA-specific exonuclease
VEVEPELAADPASTEGIPDVIAAGSAALTGSHAAANELLIDCRLPLRRLVPETFRAIRALAPYGNGFPPPVFVASGVRVIRCWRSGPEGRNLRIVLREGSVERTALWAKAGERIAALRGMVTVDVAYTLDAFSQPGWPTGFRARVLALRPSASMRTEGIAADSSAQPPT